MPDTTVIQQEHGYCPRNFVGIEQIQVFGKIFENSKKTEMKLKLARKLLFYLIRGVFQFLCGESDRLMLQFFEQKCLC
ncbi:unnamed protein product [Caenorhabditis nigoni]